MPPFTDTDFPPNSTSLGPGVCNLKGVEWKRASELLGHKEGSSIFNFTKPSDVNQGQLENCWLMSSIASLAEFEEFIKQLFVTTTWNAEGRYTVRVYAPSSASSSPIAGGRLHQQSSPVGRTSLRKNRSNQDITPHSGTWLNITVDDFLPCIGDKVVFGGDASGKVGWMSLLEKAMAKHAGSYANLQGGFPGLALTALTGQYSHRYQFVRVGGGLLRRGSGGGVSVCELDFGGLSVRKVAQQPGAIRVKKTGTKFSEDSFWSFLVECEQEGGLVVLGGSAGKDTSGGGGQAGRGLPDAHAYRVRRVLEVGPHRLCQVDDPWGRLKWRGEWSDSSPLWAQYPEVTAAARDLKAGVRGKQGNNSSSGVSVWLPYSALLTEFEGVTVNFLNKHSTPASTTTTTTSATSATTSSTIRSGEGTTTTATGMRGPHIHSTGGLKDRENHPTTWLHNQHHHQAHTSPATRHTQPGGGGHLTHIDHTRHLHQHAAPPTHDPFSPALARTLEQRRADMKASLRSGTPGVHMPTSQAMNSSLVEGSPLAGLEEDALNVRFNATMRAINSTMQEVAVTTESRQAAESALLPLAAQLSQLRPHQVTERAHTAATQGVTQMLFAREKEITQLSMECQQLQMAVSRAHREAEVAAVVQACGTTGRVRGNQQQQQQWQHNEDEEEEGGLRLLSPAQAEERLQAALQHISHLTQALTNTQDRKDSRLAHAQELTAKEAELSKQEADLARSQNSKNPNTTSSNIKLNTDQFPKTKGSKRTEATPLMFYITKSHPVSESIFARLGF